MGSVWLDLTMLRLPEAVRARAHLAGAQAWIDSLPALVTALEHDWRIIVADAYPDPTEAFVAEARTESGEPVVLKLIVPRNDDAARHEIDVLLRADGQGCARLLRHDRERGALLLERLGPSLHDLGLPISQRHEILCLLAMAIWRPAAELDLPTGLDKARWLETFIGRTWEDLDHPCGEAAVESALAALRRRSMAHDDERSVLVHGDVHEWNALQATDGFKLIDPDGLLAEPEYDLGVMMREDPVELLRGDPRDRAHWLASRTGCDAAAIWDWGVGERVATGLLATSIGLEPVGAQMLVAADAVAGLRFDS